MKFAILVYEESAEFAHREGSGAEEYWGAYNLYSASLGQAGVIAGGNVLQGSSVAWGKAASNIISLIGRRCGRFREDGATTTWRQELENEPKSWLKANRSDASWTA